MQHEVFFCEQAQNIKTHQSSANTFSIQFRVMFLQIGAITYNLQSHHLTVGFMNSIECIIAI